MMARVVLFDDGGKQNDGLRLPGMSAWASRSGGGT